MEIAAIKPGLLSRRCLRSEQKISRIELIKQKEQELIKKYTAIVSKGEFELYNFEQPRVCHVPIIVFIFITVWLV